jgi:hypothetical protein
MANKILKAVIPDMYMDAVYGGSARPAQPVDARLQYNLQREELDKRRGAVSPLLTGVAKPAPPRKGLRP